MISRKMMMKILCGNYKKVLSNQKKWLLEWSSGTSSKRTLSCNHTVFLVQFGSIKLSLVSFQKAEIALAEAARAISAFWKTHSY